MVQIYYHQRTWRDTLAFAGVVLGYLVTIFCVAASVFAIGYFLGVFVLANWLLVSTGVMTALGCFYIGCAEETMFRYIIYDRMMLRSWALSPKTAIVLSSLVFGAAHLLNSPWPMAIPQAFGAAAFGAVACYTYQKHGLLWAVVLHAVYDWVVMYWLATVFFG